jgi:hypothetical protein
MPRPQPKQPQPATTKLVLTLTNELKNALIEKAKQTFGDRKGSISAYVEMVLRNHLELSHPDVEET